MVRLLTYLSLFVILTSTSAQEATKNVKKLVKEELGMTDRKLLTIIAAAGVPNLYPAVEKIIHEKKGTFTYFPPEFYERQELDKAVFAYIRKSLTDEEIDELILKFKSPFVSKISKLYHSPIDDEVKFTNYISKYGRRAKVERLNLLDSINKILQSDGHHYELRVTIERAVKIQELRKTSEHVSSNAKQVAKAADDAIAETVASYKKARAQYNVQSLFYKNRHTTDIELAEFKRQYGKDKLLVKYYKLQNEALKNYYAVLHSRLTNEKEGELNKKKKSIGEFL